MCCGIAILKHHRGPASLSITKPLHLRPKSSFGRGTLRSYHFNPPPKGLYPRPASFASVFQDNLGTSNFTRGVRVIPDFHLSITFRQNSRSMASLIVAASPGVPPAPISSLSTVEASKRAAAYKAVEDHFDPSYRYVGIGSGSTVVYVVEAIVAQGPEITSRMRFIPTGDQSKQLILEAHLPLGSIDAMPPVAVGPYSAGIGFDVATGVKDLGLKGKRESLDVAFDGADEIDEDLNCIKGGGACLFQEKLVATSAKKFVCVADFRKLSPRLLTAWKAIPLEISPLAAPTIKRILITLGSSDPKIRQGGSAKAGPVVTDNGMWIMDAPFPRLLLLSDLKDGQKGDGTDGIWEVHQLGRRLKRIVGILEIGLFFGRNGLQVASAGEEGGGQKPVAAYFGMENGEVEVRAAKEIDSKTARA